MRRKKAFILKALSVNSHRSRMFAEFNQSAVKQMIDKVSWMDTDHKDWKELEQSHPKVAVAIRRASAAIRKCRKCNQFFVAWGHYYQKKNPNRLSCKFCMGVFKFPPDQTYTDLLTRIKQMEIDYYNQGVNVVNKVNISK